MKVDLYTAITRESGETITGFLVYFSTQREGEDSYHILEIGRLNYLHYTNEILVDTLRQDGTHKIKEMK